jgi:hypothetical protein
MFCNDIHHYQAQGCALVVVVGSKYGESIHFSKFFRGLAMPPLIPKKDILQYDCEKMVGLQLSRFFLCYP